MATQLLAVGSTAADSSELVIAAGSAATVCLKGDTSPVTVRIALKDDAGAFRVIGELTSARPVVAITAPGTYKFSRAASETVGVFSA